MAQLASPLPDVTLDADGIVRGPWSTGAPIELTPAEADALAQAIGDDTEQVPAKQPVTRDWHGRPGRTLTGRAARRAQGQRSGYAKALPGRLDYAAQAAAYQRYRTDDAYRAASLAAKAERDARKARRLERRAHSITARG